MPRLVRFGLAVVLTLAGSMFALRLAFADTLGAGSTEEHAEDSGAETGDSNAGPAAGAAGWVKPVSGTVCSGYHTSQRPGHHGVDILCGSSARGTEIRAAAAGQVDVVACQTTQGPPYCDQDGNPSVEGCGWYVRIRHDGGVWTLYCHMIRRPVVEVGQWVGAGEVIGHLGTSGSSSGPHLHFQVMVGGGSNEFVVHPEVFMAEHNAPLGP